MYIVMDASHDQRDRVGRAGLVESCGARDDSPSWNLGRDTIRVDGASPQGRGQKDVKECEKGGGRCFRMQQGQVQGQAVEWDAQLVDPTAR